MSLLGGWLCEVTYTNPLLSPSLKNYFTPIKGTGTCPLVPLAMGSYASDGGAARICQRGPKRGSEATERGEIFENYCMKTAFSCTLNTIIRGSLCTGTNSLLFFFFHSFPNEFVSGEHFPFSLSFFLFFFTRRSTGGPWPPCAPPPPPSYASAPL